MAEGPDTKKKHLLHRLVNKVHIHSRQTIEIWYTVPNTRRFADCNVWLPGCAGVLTPKSSPRHGSGFSTSANLTTEAPLSRTTAIRESKSPSGVSLCDNAPVQRRSEAPSAACRCYTAPDSSDGPSSTSTILPTTPPLASNSCAPLASARGNRCAISGLIFCC